MHTYYHMHFHKFQSNRSQCLLQFIEYTFCLFSQRERIIIEGTQGRGREREREREGRKRERELTYPSVYEDIHTSSFDLEGVELSVHWSSNDQIIIAALPKCTYIHVHAQGHVYNIIYKTSMHSLVSQNFKR